MTTGRINQVTSAVRIKIRPKEIFQLTNRTATWINKTAYTFTLTRLSCPIVLPYSLTLHSIISLLIPKYYRPNTARVEVKFTQHTSTNCTLAENVSQTTQNLQFTQRVTVQFTLTSVQLPYFRSKDPLWNVPPLNSRWIRLENTRKEKPLPSPTVSDASLVNHCQVQPVDSYREKIPGNNPQPDKINYPVVGKKRLE